MTVVLVAIIALAAAFALLWWRTRHDLRRKSDELRQLSGAVDQVDTGFVIYDAADRIVLASPAFRALYPGVFTDPASPPSFDAVLQASLDVGEASMSDDERQSWLDQRRRIHADGGTFERQIAPGRWRRVTEKRLPDGSVVAFSIDVSDLVQKSEDLEAARATAAQERQRLQDVIEAIPTGFSLYDADDRLVLTNQTLREMWPMVAETLKHTPHPTYESLLRKNIADGAIAGITPENGDAYVAKRMAQRQLPSNQILMRNATHWLRTYEKRLGDGSMVSIWADVTEGVLQSRATEAARARLQDAIDALPEGFALFDPEDRLVTCNAHYRELNPESVPAIVVGNTFEAMLRFGIERGQYPQATAQTEDWIDERMARHRQPEGELMQQQDGNRWLRISERKTRDGGTATVITDVTKMVQREQALQQANRDLDAARLRLEQLSDTDGLTGIANRRLLDRRLLEEWQRSRRLQQPMSLLVVDVDHFKRFNDAHGHLEGDRCLRQIAKLLQTVLRRPTDVVARFGGEEFVILLAHTDIGGAQRVAQECLAAIDAAAIAHGDSPVSRFVTISVGCASAVATQEGGDPQALLGAADAALFRAKQGGRHQVCAAGDP